MGKKNEPFLCGDETGALVVDYGTWSVKCGFAGVDLPKSDHISQVAQRQASQSAEMAVDGGYICGMSKLLANLTSLEINEGVQAMDNGYQYNMDCVEANIKFAFEDVLSAKLENHPLLWATHSTLGLKQKAELASILIEKYNVPAFYPAPSSMLESFSAGKQTSFVVNLGHSYSTFEAINEGFRIRKSFAFLENQFCGNAINNEIKAWLEDSQPNGYSKYYLRDVATIVHSTINQWKEQHTLHDIKATFYRALAEPYSEDDVVEYEDETYELPDKNLVTISKERFHPVEKFFNPTFMKSSINKNAISEKDLAYGTKGLHHWIQESLLRAHPDIRKDLAYNIIVTGGTSLTPGLTERLTKELTLISPSLMKPRFLSFPEKCQRHYAAWIGGSILASLGTFQQLWISKEEIDEYGVDQVLLNKCLQ